MAELHSSFISEHTCALCTVHVAMPRAAYKCCLKHLDLHLKLLPSRDWSVFLGIPSFLLFKSIVDGCWGRENHTPWEHGCFWFLQASVAGPTPMHMWQALFGLWEYQQQRNTEDRRLGRRCSGSTKGNCKGMMVDMARIQFINICEFQRMNKTLEIYSSLICFLLPFLSLYI